MVEEKELTAESYIGFNGNILNNIILVREEKLMDPKIFKEKIKCIEEEKQLENEKKKKMKKVYNLKNIDVNDNYFQLKKEELEYNFYMIYAIGTNIIKEQILNNERTILKTDINKINKLYVDKNNKYICCCKLSKLISDIYIFDFKNKNKPIILSIHKFKTNDISISTDGKYLLSSGGEDDKKLILTDIKNQKQVFKSISDYPYTNISFFHKSNNFIIAKLNSIKICFYNFNKKLMTELEINTSIYKRQFICLELKENDEYAFLGTTTGDILIINIKSKVLERIVPENYLFANGVNVIKIINDNTILTGSGDGYVSLISIEDKKIINKKKIYGSINSIQMRNESTLFVSVYENIIYVMDLINNSHYVLLINYNGYIRDICFPNNYNYIMFTCSYNCICAWKFYEKKIIYLKNVDKGKFIYYDKKMLNIPIEKKKKICKMHANLIKKKENELNKNEEKYEKINKKLNCHCVRITDDGKYVALAIHSNIYILTPKYMKNICVIFNSHYDYCNILLYYNNYDLISGGNNGDIKFWKFKDNKYININTINYFSSIVKQLILYKDKYLCSCSENGLITVYNIEENTLEKKIIDINNIKYKLIALNKKYDILICSGNNNLFMYYDLIKYDFIKHFYYSPFYNVHCIDVHISGNYFITGSDDYKLRLYDFKTCSCLYTGTYHNDIINKCLFTYDNQYIISISKDESIIYWKMPQDIKEINDTTIQIK